MWDYSGGGLSGVKRNECDTCCEMSFSELVVKNWSFKIVQKDILSQQYLSTSFKICHQEPPPSKSAFILLSKVVSSANLQLRKKHNLICTYFPLKSIVPRKGKFCYLLLVGPTLTQTYFCFFIYIEGLLGPVLTFIMVLK